MDYTKYVRNKELEEEMQLVGLRRYQSIVNNSVQKGQESTTKYGLQLIQSAIDPLSKAIVDFIDRAFGGAKGRRHISAKYLQLIPADICAFITLKSLMDSITLGQTLNKASIRIGTALEDQYRFQIFSNEKSGLFRTLMKDLQAKSNYRYKKRVLTHTMNKKDIMYDNWTNVDKLHIGTKCIELVIEATGLIKIVMKNEGSKGRRDTPKYVEATEKTMEWITNKNERNEILSPAFTPTIIPPKDWVHPFRGGYHSPLIKPIPFVKVRNRGFLEEISNRVGDMQTTYEAVNILQATPWKVEKRTYQVLDYCWNSSDSIGKLPTREDLPLPPKPEDIATNLQARIEWKRKSAKIYDYNAKLKSKRIQIEKVRQIANKYQNEQEIYFVKQCDFRGRIYDVPMFLNPSANDVAKSLLVFAHGKPIGNEESLSWLAIHGANLYGHDKLKLEDRVEFIKQNTEMICNVGSDPLNYKWWQKADSPWQFLSFCFEFNDFIKSGSSSNFITHLPVSIDHTNSGVQHFSGMLKDEVGGASTNLIPNDEPADIYQDVADLVIIKLKNSSDLLAQQWLEFGINRKTTKRATMVKPYSGTRQSCREYIEEHIVEREEKGEAHPFGDDLFKASNYLSKYVYESINETVVKADECMKWLQQVSRLVSNENLPVIWTTPNGFPVFMAYFDMESKRIKTKLGDSTIKLTVNTETKKIAKRRVASAISPNYIHSLDANMLQDAVVLAKKYGIENISTVHDCFSVLSCDAIKMHNAIREAFVSMYSRPVLENFKAEIEKLLSEKNKKKIPPLPEYGNLDLEKVKDSLFFCS